MIRFPSMSKVAPNKVQDPTTDSFVSVETYQCSQLPQSLNNSSPRIMRKSTIVGQVQRCATDGNKHQIGRFVIKYEVLTGDLPEGATELLEVDIAGDDVNNFKFSQADVVDTLNAMLVYVYDQFEIGYPLAATCE
jgi:hypothetical protein